MLVPIFMLVAQKEVIFGGSEMVATVPHKGVNDSSYQPPQSLRYQDVNKPSTPFNAAITRSKRFLLKKC